jgi:hypothetical protein
MVIRWNGLQYAGNTLDKIGNLIVSDFVLKYLLGRVA